MKTLRYLGLLVLVVFITAFASGCGGGDGGGGAMMEEEPPVVEPDPGPTDAERITDAQDTLAGIVANARTLELAARTAANSVYAHPDATDAQIDLAINYLLEAQTLLTEIVGASGSGMRPPRLRRRKARWRPQGWRITT